MLIEVVRSGGVAGITRRGSVDTDQLGDDAPEWHGLLDAALPMLDTIPSAAPSAPMPDGFTWQLSLGDRSCETGDSYLTGPLRELAERTLKQGGRRR